MVKTFICVNLHKWSVTINRVLMIYMREFASGMGYFGENDAKSIARKVVFLHEIIIFSAILSDFWHAMSLLYIYLYLISL